MYERVSGSADRPGTSSLSSSSSLTLSSVTSPVVCLCVLHRFVISGVCAFFFWIVLLWLVGFACLKRVSPALVVEDAHLTSKLGLEIPPIYSQPHRSMVRQSPASKRVSARIYFSSNLRLLCLLTSSIRCDPRYRFELYKLRFWSGVKETGLRFVQRVPV